MRVGTLLGIAVGLAACADVPAPVAPLRTLDQAPALSAATSSSSLTLPFNQSIWVSCANGGAGETVNVSGELEIRSHTTVDANGGTRLVTHYRPSQVTGVGQVTGLKYRGVGGAVLAELAADDGTPSVYTLVDIFRIIGQGPGNNIQMHRIVHQTINANGELTADVSLASADCK